MLISGGSSDNLIGGTTPAARNVISSNGQHGVHIYDSADNQVEGNYIGTDVSGTKPLGNLQSGAYIDDGSANNTIGGTASGDGNVISANMLRGVHIDTKSNNNLVEGNDIGTDATGTKPLANDDSGVLIAGGSTGNIIGGSTTSTAM